MTTELIQELTADPRLLYQHTAAEYHRMIKSGMIEEGEPFELLEGQIVRKIRSAQGENPMTVGDRHAYAVMKLTELARKLPAQGCHLRPQQPITLPPTDEPEPDAAVVRGRIEDYRGRHPHAADVICVIEVADASLRRDRTIKQRIYAKAAIAIYVIVNLQGDLIEVYTKPKSGRYENVRKLNADKSLRIPTPAGRGWNFSFQKITA
ncbi:MAG TPA: Uma2 family endonuclease [Tepidisphaeraceae bacterium]|nr:Uma2 family endonuclease [Tepidisphaeraceae bacterium]